VRWVRNFPMEWLQRSRRVVKENLSRRRLWAVGSGFQALAIRL
jgi:hypothetical protein